MSSPLVVLTQEQDSATDDVLLLVTADGSGISCGALEELLLRVRHRARVDASLLSMGSRAHADIGGMLARAPARAVAVPLALGGCDPLLDDLSGLLRWARSRWPDVTVLQSAPLASSEHLLGWIMQQVRRALGECPTRESVAETAVMVVGQAHATAAVNAEVCALARMLWERGDHGWVEAAFVHEQAGRPSIAERIEECRHRGMRKVIVAPLALLDGPGWHSLHAIAGAVDDLHVKVAGPLLTPAGAAAIVLKRFHDAVARWREARDDGLSLSHHHDRARPQPPSPDAMLPPRYRGGGQASAMPMRSAALRYDGEGRVAWNEVWQSFCDLALAGGPPHRGTLLEPALREEVRDDPESYARVVAEIARGLALITRLPVITDAAPGWVGLVCADDEMALWLLRAIVVENVSVRREGATLFLPAGPRYRVEKEIRNVITAVAKTHHYWTEHRAAR